MIAEVLRSWGMGDPWLSLAAFALAIVVGCAFLALWLAIVWWAARDAPHPGP